MYIFFITFCLLIYLFFAFMGIFKASRKYKNVLIRFGGSLCLFGSLYTLELIFIYVQALIIAFYGVDIIGYYTPSFEIEV